MPANYVLLEKITVGAAGASSVTFSGIPQTGYTDLVIKGSMRQSSSSITYATLKFNGSSSNFTYRSLEGSGSTAGSFNGSTGVFGVVVPSGYTASTFSNIEFYIPNYTSSNYKSYSSDSVMENNATQSYSDIIAVLWSNTAAITSIELTPGSGSFDQYSTFYLYGVAKLGTTPVIVPYATGGDTIMTDGTYWYHTFLSSGTFTPQKGITCDYLVVAGGGGGNSYGSGGGAGGLRSTVTATGGGGSLETALSLGTSAYTVTIGAGGSAGSTGSPWTSSNGSNSVFSTITSTGGGGVAQSTGQTGGSGGGSNFGGTAGTGTANQGFAGGVAPSGALYPGGGGGGAGAVGATGTDGNPSGTVGGNGGIGVATSISGSSVYYAGGGGGGAWYAQPGGTGGTGGGGNGGRSTATSGTANTGGGGGGAGSSSGSSGALGSGGNGGSGIVIVRYAV